MFIHPVLKVSEVMGGPWAGFNQTSSDMNSAFQICEVSGGMVMGGLQVIKTSESRVRCNAHPSRTEGF